MPLITAETNQSFNFVFQIYFIFQPNKKKDKPRKEKTFSDRSVLTTAGKQTTSCILQDFCMLHVKYELSI